MEQNNQLLDHVETLLIDVETFLEKTRWKDKYLLAIKSLHQELNDPCILAVTGQVKAGKSSLINALLHVDLALTGTTETTATINVFKNGTPKSADKPILCIWRNGQKEWVSKDFLNQLQGTKEETLKLAANIDRFVYYIEGNPLLEQITLVDTPGIGAIVGEGGDAHQIQTDSYFQLRNIHSEETVSLSNSADAVLYLFKGVPDEMDTKFLHALYNGGEGLSAINGIGVLAKSDMTPSLLEDIQKYKNLYQSELFTILPASATLSQFLPSVETISKISEMISPISDERTLNFMMGSDSMYFDPNLPSCPLSIDKRIYIFKILGEKQLPWSTFRFIITTIYHSESAVVARERLEHFAGIEKIRDLLYSHFFQRSKILRCHKVLYQIIQILETIQYDQYFFEAAEYASHKEECISACESIADPAKSILKQLIEHYIDDVHEIQKKRQKIENLIESMKQIQKDANVVNNSYLAFHELVKYCSEFSPTEYEELYALFTNKPLNVNYQMRIAYWNGVVNSVLPNGIRYRIALAAKQAYMLLCR